MMNFYCLQSNLCKVWFLGFSKTPFQGAEPAINAATNPDLKGVRDVYYEDCKPHSTSSDARFVWKVAGMSVNYAMHNCFSPYQLRWLFGMCS